MLAAAEGDEYDVIVAWHTNRLHRSPRDLEGFIDVIERAKINVATVKAGDMDLATPSGRMVARMLGAAARHESEHKADRLRRKMLEKAQRGEPTGSRRPYGFEADKITHRKVEADVIREVADRIIARRDLLWDRARPQPSGHHLGVLAGSGRPTRSSGS